MVNRFYVSYYADGQVQTPHRWFTQKPKYTEVNVLNTWKATYHNVLKSIKIDNFLQPS